MAKQTVNIGSFVGDPTADITRDAFDKINDNFNELYASFTYDISQSQLSEHNRSLILMRGNSLTYTLVNSLSIETGVPFYIIQNGTGFSIDSTAINANIPQALQDISGSVYVITKTGTTTGTDNYTILQIGAAYGSGAFFELDGSSPLIDPTADGYRTGKTGFGQSTPTELIHVEGNQASGSGAFKNRFDYNDGLLVLNHLGGNNIGTELGFPSNALKGALLGYITGNPNYVGQQMVIMGGDFLLAGAQKNWGWTIGNFSTNGQEYSAIFTEPQFTNSVDDFLTKVKSINANGDHAHIHAKTKGYENQTTAIEDFGQEALIELNAENTEGDRTRVYVSPHRVQLTNLLKLPEYASDTFVEGYTHTDDVSKTGTAATVLGAPVKSLAVDANGYVVRTYAKSSVTADTATAVDLSNPFGNYCNQSSANANTSFTTSNEVAGGKARVLINAATEPTVTGGTKIKGSDFVASTDIYLFIEYNGTNVEFWFEEI